MFVWKGALRLPECACPLIHLFKLHLQVLCCARDKETGNNSTAVSNIIISVSQLPLGLTVLVQVEEGGPKLHLAHLLLAHASTPHLKNVALFLS